MPKDTEIDPLFIDKHRLVEIQKQERAERARRSAKILRNYSPQRSSPKSLRGSGSSGPRGTSSPLGGGGSSSAPLFPISQPTSSVGVNPPSPIPSANPIIVMAQPIAIPAGMVDFPALGFSLPIFNGLVEEDVELHIREF